MKLVWRLPFFYGNCSDEQVWHLFDESAPRGRRMLGAITYLGLTRHANWADRLQRWRVNRIGETAPEGQVIKVKSAEEAKNAALVILVLS